jgi:hypothetical protein
MCRLSTTEQYPGLRSIALLLTAFFGSTYLCKADFSQMKIIKSRHRSRLTDEHLKYCLHLCLSNFEPSFSKLSQGMQCHAYNHNRKVSEKHILIMVNWFSLKRSIFNKRNNCTFICLMLLCHFTFHCLVHLILNYVLW